MLWSRSVCRRTYKGIMDMMMMKMNGGDLIEDSEEPLEREKGQVILMGSGGRPERSSSRAWFQKHLDGLLRFLEKGRFERIYVGIPLDSHYTGFIDLGCGSSRVVIGLKQTQDAWCLPRSDRFRASEGGRLDGPCVGTGVSGA